MGWLAGTSAALIVVLLGTALRRPTPVRVLGDRCRGEDPVVPGLIDRTAVLRRGVARATVVRTAVIGSIVIVAVSVIGPIGTCAFVAGLFGWRRLAPILETRNQRRRIEADMPDAIELFVLGVHAGLTPRQAVEQLARRAPAPLRDGFGSVVDRLERGEPLADALRALTDVLGPTALPLVDLVGTADRYGLPLGPVLEQLAIESRTTRRRLDEAAARSLPVKLSFPLVACTLPSFVLLAIVPAVLAALSSLGGDAW